MNNLKLIECVREYTFLYDLSDRRYSDNQLKDSTWKEIGKKLKVQGKVCKKSWSLLRDAFRRAIKKQKEAKAFVRKYKYEDEMAFLLPYFKDRSTICTIPSTKEEILSYDEEDVSNDDTGGISVYSEIETLQRSHEIPAVVKSQTSTPEIFSGPSGYKSMQGPKQARIHQSANEQYFKETPSTPLMEYILENKKANAVEQFFDSISTTVQSFPPQEQAIAKSKVFAVISEMEIEILRRGTQH